MPRVSETIPEALQPRVDAALAWFNASSEAEESEFEVTGILDAEEALGGSDELRLILCGGDRCEQRSFRVSGTPGAWQVDFGPLSEMIGLRPGDYIVDADCLSTVDYAATNFTIAAPSDSTDAGTTTPTQPTPTTPPPRMTG